MHDGVKALWNEFPGTVIIIRELVQYHIDDTFNDRYLCQQVMVLNMAGHILTLDIIWESSILCLIDIANVDPFTIPVPVNRTC